MPLAAGSPPPGGRAEDGGRAEEGLGDLEGRRDDGGEMSSGVEKVAEALSVVSCGWRGVDIEVVVGREFLLASLCIC